MIRTAITIYEIPSNALGPELSKDYVERSSLLSFRYWFGWWGGLAVWNSLWIFVVYSTLTGTQDARFVADTWMTYGLVCSPIMFLAIVVTVIGSLRSFDMVAIMTQGGPYGSTNVLAYYMFETALSEYGYRMGYGSAIAAVLFTIMMFYILFFIYRMYQSEKKGL